MIIWYTMQLARRGVLRNYLGLPDVIRHTETTRHETGICVGMSLEMARLIQTVSSLRTPKNQWSSFEAQTMKSLHDG